MSGLCVPAERTIRDLEIHSHDLRPARHDVSDLIKPIVPMSNVLTRRPSWRQPAPRSPHGVPRPRLRSAFASIPTRSSRCRSRFPISWPGSPADAQVGADVAGVITNNLKRSGLFAPIDQAAFIERITNIDVAPKFQNWKTINAQDLVTGRMTRQGDGRLKAEFRLWDVALGSQATGAAIFHRAGILAPHRPYHLRPDLREADRREGLFRQPRRLRR